MSFQSLDDAMRSLTQFSRDAVTLYEAKQNETGDAAARSCLELAIRRERRLRRGAAEAVEDLSEKQRRAMFKWQDKRLLGRIVPGLVDKRITSVDDALELVKECDEGALGYCRALTASSNSEEVIILIFL